MKLKVAMDEKPTVITTGLPAEEMKSSDKTHSYKKVIVISVAAVCIAVAVIAGFVFAFKYHTEATNKIITSHLNEHGLDETIEEDVDENTKMFTVNDGETRYYVLEDYNRNMQLTKINGMCIVAAMNASLNAEDHSFSWQVDTVPIKDRSILSQKGQDLCEDELIYWMWPKCDGDNENDIKNTGENKEEGSGSDLGERSKRSYFWYKAAQCPVDSSPSCCITTNACYYYQRCRPRSCTFILWWLVRIADRRVVHCHWAFYGSTC